MEGQRPYQYNSETTRAARNPAFLATYVLCTGDWFESGTQFAYSLHRTGGFARTYRPFSSWAKEGIRRVFVNNRVAQELKQRRELFVSEER